MTPPSQSNHPRVWIITGIAYDDYGIYGVYSSLERALKHDPKLTWEQIGEDWFGWYGEKPRDFGGLDHGYTVDVHEVDA